MNRDRKVGRETIKNLILGSILPLFLLLVWQLWAMNQSQVIPRPIDVLAVLADPFASPPNLDSLPLAHSCGISVLRVLIGFIAAVVTAIPLGLLAGRIPIVRKTIMPILELGRPICPIAWLPVAILIFGFASIGSLIWHQEAWRYPILDQLQLAMIAIIWWGGFFPVFINTVHGVEQVKRMYIESAKMLGASDRKIFFDIILPSALPNILTGMRVGLGISWMVIIAAEIFPGTRAGLGYMIATSHQVAEYQYTFASIILIAAIGLLSGKVLYLISDRVSKWQIMER